MTWLWGVPALAAAVYYAIAFAGGLRRLRDMRQPVAPWTPPVSILKPVHGRDPRFYEAIRSHAVLEYPEYEILFGVRSLDDAAVADIRRLQAEYPDHAIRLIEAGAPAPNGKVAVLEALAAAARHDVLLVNDSDIAVEPPYLKQVVAGLADPRVGMVKCLYRASGHTAPAQWEALGVATDFAPGVLVAPLVGIDGFALGSTMAFRREQLDAIGGFAAIRDYLADDYQLGTRIAALGYRTVLAPVVVETHLGGDTWGDVWRHQLRWSRTIRVSRRAGYYGYLAAQASFWAIVAAAGGQWWPAGIALAARLATAWLVGEAVLGDRTVRPRLGLVPVRDLWGFAVWIAGLVGNTVQWRDQELRLSPDGRIVSVRSARGARTRQA